MNYGVGRGGLQWGFTISRAGVAGRRLSGESGSEGCLYGSDEVAGQPWGYNFSYP
jgi:hypothetical protein